jgi:hypothetical protein
MTPEDNIPEEEENEEIELLNDNTLGNSVISSDGNDYDSDMERYKQAIAASEAAYTLEPEKGLTPDPDTLNKEEEKERNNIKK